MAKREYVEYTCDRCGAKIIGDHPPWKCLGHFQYMHVFKWFVPVTSRYKLLYFCPSCWESFKTWAFLDKED